MFTTRMNMNSENTSGELHALVAGARAQRVGTTRRTSAATDCMRPGTCARDEVAPIVSAAITASAISMNSAELCGMRSHNHRYVRGEEIWIWN